MLIVINLFGYRIELYNWTAIAFIFAISMIELGILSLIVCALNR